MFEGRDDHATETPIGLVDRFASSQEWYVYDKSGEHLAAEVNGDWSSYDLEVKWDEADEMLRVVCRIDEKAHHERHGEMALFASMVNDRLQFAHLALDTKRGALDMHYALVLCGAEGATSDQVSEVVDVMLGECDAVYPGISQVASGELDAHSAAEAVIMITEGEA